jgi:hypothetical protein
VAVVAAEWQELFDAGTYASWSELAHRMGFSRARVSQVLRPPKERRWFLRAIVDRFGEARPLAAQQIDMVAGTSRPDVAEQFGRPDWTQSGFTATWTPAGLTAGPHNVVVSARASQGGGDSSAVTVAVAGPALYVAPLAPAVAPQVAVPQIGVPHVVVPAPPRGPVAPGDPAAAPVVLVPLLPPCTFSPYDAALPPCPR